MPAAGVATLASAEMMPSREDEQPGDGIEVAVLTFAVGDSVGLNNRAVVRVGVRETRRVRQYSLAQRFFHCTGRRDRNELIAALLSSVPEARIWVRFSISIPARRLGISRLDHITSLVIHTPKGLLAAATAHFTELRDVSNSVPTSESAQHG